MVSLPMEFFQQMLGTMPRQQFVEEFFHRQPLAVPNLAGPLCEQVKWESVCDLFQAHDADVMVVKQGQQYAQPETPNEESFRKLLSEGHTVLIRHAERHSEILRELAAHFTAEFHAPVDVHVYVTPPGEFGFSWHYDAEDVFILQTAGRKEYSLRKNTVHPWPLVETIPQDMKYPREIMPFMRVLLAPGDWLYIPNGYWHQASAQESDEPSISVALGVLSPSAIHLFDRLRSKLLDSLLWRSRLPVTGGANSQSHEQCLTQYRELISLLTADLKRQLEDEQFLTDFLNGEEDKG